MSNEIGTIIPPHLVRDLIRNPDLALNALAKRAFQMRVCFSGRGFSQAIDLPAVAEFCKPRQVGDWPPRLRIRSAMLTNRGPRSVLIRGFDLFDLFDLIDHDGYVVRSFQPRKIGQGLGGLAPGYGWEIETVLSFAAVSVEHSPVFLESQSVTCTPFKDSVMVLQLTPDGRPSLSWEHWNADFEKEAAADPVGVWTRLITPGPNGLHDLWMRFSIGDAVADIQVAKASFRPCGGIGSVKLESLPIKPERYSGSIVGFDLIGPGGRVLIRRKPENFGAVSQVDCTFRYSRDVILRQKYAVRGVFNCENLQGTDPAPVSAPSPAPVGPPPSGSKVENVAAFRSLLRLSDDAIREATVMRFDFFAGLRPPTEVPVFQVHRHTPYTLLSSSGFDGLIAAAEVAIPHPPEYIASNATVLAELWHGDTRVGWAWQNMTAGDAKLRAVVNLTMP
jgi:hypothetical protein